MLTAMKIESIFKGETPYRTREVDFRRWTLKEATGMNVQDKCIIFDSGKTEKADISNFEMKKFFTPYKSFLPPFLAFECSKLDFEDLQYSRISSWQKGGKKLSSGVKNFFISKYTTSSLTWIKN